MYTPVNEGVDHINIYSKSGTELGRLLSNFSKSPFKHPSFGQFMSVEGFWYWLSTGCKHDELKQLWGNKAKLHGRNLPKVKIDNFDSIITEAIELKVRNSDVLKSMLITNELPLAHYYYFGSIDNCKIVAPAGGEWLIDIFNNLKVKFKGEQNGTSSSS